MDAHTYFGDYTNAQGELILTLQERMRHIAIVGGTGSGKSTLLRHLARQDIERGDGLLLLDQHGDLAEAVLFDVPPRRHNHVCYLNLATSPFRSRSMCSKTRSPTIALRPSTAS